MPVVAGALILASCGGTSSRSNSNGAPDVKPYLLAKSDLGRGWKVSANRSTGSFGAQGCAAFDAVKNVHDSDSVQFNQFVHGNLPELSEAIGWSRSAQAVFRVGTEQIAKCKHVAITDNGVAATASVSPFPFPAVAEESVGYRLAIEVEAVSIDFDIVIARKGSYLCLIALGDLGSPDITELEQLTVTAVGKLP